MIEWKQQGFRTQKDYAYFCRTRDWIMKTQMDTINRQVGLLMQCGLKLEDMMIVAWPDGTWRISMQRKPEET